MGSASSRFRWTRVAAVVAPAATFVALLGVGLGRSDGPPAPGDTAPTFTAPLLGETRTVSLAELRGRPVLLNFWASWCAPCRDEAPMLRHAHQEFGDGVTFVGIVVRDSERDALEFAARHGLDYFHLRDSELTIYDDYGLTGQPESFLIDADGTIVEHVQGPFAAEGDLVALLRQVTSGGG
jgi:cytochrome c biogenesis protein CcmG, thiol:disulfide interchange protein DsbE